MEFDPEKHRRKALSKKRENTLFYKKLKRKPPKDIDSVVQEIHEEVFGYIDCLSCAHCCKSTGPLLTTRDIKRISKHLRMKEAEFEEKYLKRDEDGDMVFRTLPCPFLAADNYCMIYDVRPKACEEYPHTDRRKFLSISRLTLKNIEICPAVYEVTEILKKRYG